MKKLKLTDEVVEALKSGIESSGSLRQFSDQVNVNRKTLVHFLRRRTQIITADTWEKIYPLLKPYLPENADEIVGHVTNKNKTGNAFAKYVKEGLGSDEKILLDAFSVLPAALREEKLLELVKLAKQEINQQKKQDELS